VERGYGAGAAAGAGAGAVRALDEVSLAFPDHGLTAVAVGLGQEC
jgi:hypothetical protein